MGAESHVGSLIGGLKCYRPRAPSFALTFLCSVVLRSDPSAPCRSFSHLRPREFSLSRALANDVGPGALSKTVPDAPAPSPALLSVPYFRKHPPLGPGRHRRLNPESPSCPPAPRSPSLSFPLKHRSRDPESRTRTTTAPAPTRKFAQEEIEERGRTDHHRVATTRLKKKRQP